MFDELYCGNDYRDRDIFDKDGVAYCGPVRFRHGKWHPVAKIPKSSGDGHPVTIEECRYPARFFRLIAHESKDSVMRPMPGFKLSTGSGDRIGKLLVEIGKAIAGGMLSLEVSSE